MKTFQQFVDEGLFSKLKARFTKKPAAPSGRGFLKGKKEARPERHAFYPGDIEPSSVPVFKSSWQDKK